MNTLLLENRSFLFLQGPHGWFFGDLARQLQSAGSKVFRVNFNGGDRRFWSKRLPYQNYVAPLENWEKDCEQIYREQGITDIVLYGDTREIHAKAIGIALAHQIRIHVFEEGYIRPYWVSYERNGSNAHSELMKKNLQDIQAERASRDIDLQEAPANWGAAFSHKWAGFLYHWHLVWGKRRFPNYRSHRDVRLSDEVIWNFVRMMLSPWVFFRRKLRTRKFLRRGRGYYVALLQLEHDSSLVAHSDYPSQEQYIAEVISAFAENAPAYRDLVFKRHPFDDFRVPYAQWVEKYRELYQVVDRVAILDGGKLAEIINPCQAVIAINSTGVQHALWRGVPVKLLGRSVFALPEIVSQQNLLEFFQEPEGGDKNAFLEFRSYLLETSQIIGSYYTKSGRANITRNVVEKIFQEHGPYHSKATIL